MADPMTDPSAIACPWCSAAITADTAVCPSCKAILIADEEHDLPGLTTIDETVTRRDKRPPQRSRFLAWLGGEPAVQPPATTVEVNAIAPPDEDVQREILRLELEAHISNLQAEADSILSDALEEGRVTDLAEGLRPLAEAEAAAETPAETADALVDAAMTTPAADVPDVDEPDADEPEADHTDADHPDADPTEADKPA